MANSSQGAQTVNTAGSGRNVAQSLVVAFERDESLAGALLAQVRAQGYECRSAKTPVEVFDLIARYPVGVVLVNLGQPATGRREFWVALDAQRRGRGVQVITYRYLVPGAGSDGLDGGGRATPADVEIRGAQGFGSLLDALRSRLPLPSRPPEGSGFLGSPPPPPITAVKGQPAGQGGRAPIAGVLHLNTDAPPGQPHEFRPMSDAPTGGLSIGEWMPQVSGMDAMAGGQAMADSIEQQRVQWLDARTDQPVMPEAPNAPARPAMPAQNQMNASPSPAPAGANHMTHPPQMTNGQPGRDLASLTDAINALAAAGAPGYHQAAAAASAMNTASTESNAPRWGQEAGRPGQEAALMGGRGMGNAEPASGSPAMNDGRRPSGQITRMNQMMNGQPERRPPAEASYPAQQAFEELRQAQAMNQSQGTRSRSISGGMDELEFLQRGTSHALYGSADETYPGRDQRPSGGMGLNTIRGPADSHQNQMLSPMPAATYIERSLGNVLVEGQLVSQQRLEVALGIQRLLRGVDIDYRLGELLLLFKFLTPDQLLAALLVSRGMVTPAQVAAMGRIKQELHAIGMEYDLENLLVLFRLLSSDQLREIRAEFP
jgi:hypothetical protein